jgi:hypothetical protein
MNNPNKVVNVTIGDGEGSSKSGSTTQGEIGKALINATVSYSSAKSDNNATFGNGALTLYSKGVGQGEDGLAATIIHEGMHGTKMDSQFRKQFSGDWYPSWMGGESAHDKFNSAHQVNNSPPGEGYRGAAKRAYEDWDE